MRNLHRSVYVFNSFRTIPRHSRVARFACAFGRSSDRLCAFAAEFHGGCEEPQKLKINDVSSWNLHRNVYVFNSILKLTSRSYVEWARKTHKKH